MATKKRKRKSDAELLIDAALIWHGATVLNLQCENDSSADAYLRRRCVRFLKKNPDMSGMRVTVVKP